MNEDQARTILDRVQQHWGVSLGFLWHSTYDDLLEDLKEDPVDNYTVAEVREAIDVLYRVLRRGEEPA